MWESCLKRFLKYFVQGEIKLFLKGGENKIFDVSNLGGELVYFCFYICASFCLCLSFHTCIYLFVECFRKLQVNSFEVAIECQYSKFYCTNFNSFIVDLFFTLRITRLNPPQVFYRFGFLGLSYRCVLYFPYFTII